MGLKMGLGLETLAALRAGVGPEAGVDKDMLLKVVLVTENPRKFMVLKFPFGCFYEDLGCFRLSL